MPDVDRLPSGRWQARTRVDRRQVKRSFRTKAEAVAWLAETATDSARGQYVDHKAGRATVTEYARQWAAGRPHRVTTAQRVKSSIDQHLDGTVLGSTPLRDVRPSLVQSWATGRAEVMAPSTLRVLVSLLRSVFGAAVLDGAIARSPVVRVTLPRSDRARLVPLTVGQVHALAEGMPDRYRAAVILQASTGLRLGELLALRREDVDQLRRELHVRSQFASGGTVRSEPKTPKSRRTVPMPQVAVDAVARHMAAYPCAEDGSIFTSASGRSLRGDYFGTTVFRAAVKAGGLPEGTTSHTLRHFYASVLLAAGESVVAVAERLGHDDASLVLRTYGHLLTGQDDRTRRAIDAAWCAPDVPAEVRTVL